MLQRIPMNGTAKQLGFVLITMLIYISTGVCGSYMAFLLHQLDLPDSTIHLNIGQKTWLAASLGLLTPLGNLGAGFFMDVYGRRKCILFMFVPFIFSWTLISIATNYTMLLIAMIVKSLALGMFVSIITYVSEISTTKYRGLLLSMVDVTINLGVLLSSTLLYFLKWNVVSFIFIGTSFASLLLTLTLPESPVWLYSKGKKEEAIEILCALRSQERHELQDEIRDMEKSHSKKNRETRALSFLRDLSRAWKQLTIASLLFFLIVLSGPYHMFSYSIQIIEKLKIPYDAPTIALIYATSGFCGSFLTPFFVHNLKRGVLLSISAGGMSLSMLAILLYEVFYLENEKKPCAWLVPTFLCLFVLMCNSGALPVGLILGGEIFPLENRGTLHGMYGCLAGFFWAASLKFYPLIMYDYGIRPLLLCFVAASVLLVLYAVFILPETKGKTLNEVQENSFILQNIADNQTYSSF